MKNENVRHRHLCGAREKALLLWVAGPMLYVVNKFFITHDEESYRIEKGFVKHCEVLPSSEIPFFRGQRAFAIVRVFLKTAANTWPMRLGGEADGVAAGLFFWGDAFRVSVKYLPLQGLRSLRPCS